MSWNYDVPVEENVRVFIHCFVDLRFIFETEEWVRYHPRGVYEKITVGEARQYIYDRLKELVTVVTVNMLTRAMQIITMERGVRLDHVDTQQEWCLSNGFLDLSTLTLTPHVDWYREHAQRVVTVQLPVEFHPEPGETPWWDRVRSAYPSQITVLENFLMQILVKNYSQELAFFGVGPSHSGKGVIATMIEAIFAPLITTVELQSLGERFGLAPLLHKRIVLDKEMRIGHWDAATVRQFKSIVGGDQHLLVDMKNVRQFEADFQLHMIAFANQLFTVPNTDLNALCRRFWIEQFLIHQSRDEELKERIREDASNVFSELCWMIYSYHCPHPLLIPTSRAMEDHIQRQRERYERWANPTKFIVKLLYERGEEWQTKAADEVLDQVEQTLMDMHFSIPKEQALKKLVTEALMDMGCRRKRAGRNQEAQYTHIREREAGGESRRVIHAGPTPILPTAQYDVILDEEEMD